MTQRYPLQWPAGWPRAYPSGREAIESAAHDEKQRALLYFNQEGGVIVAMSVPAIGTLAFSVREFWPDDAARCLAVTKWDGRADMHPDRPLMYCKLFREIPTNGLREVPSL